MKKASTPQEAKGEPADKGQARREQVLAAAAACFSRDGFHGASMAEISREAGMSVGHIYHYFTNKEAIIAAIVEREQQRILAINADIRRYDDWAEGMIEQVARGVAENVDSKDQALLLEVLAEAARNPAVARIVQESDAQVRSRIAETLGVASGRGASLPDLAGRMEVLAALFEGLHSRAVRNPQLDRAAITRVMQQMMRVLLQP